MTKKRISRKERLASLKSSKCQATLEDITVNGKSYACIIEHPEFNEFRNENGILIIDPDYHERSKEDKEAFLKEVTVEFTKEEEEQFLEAFNQVNKNKKEQWLAKEEVLKIQSKLKPKSDEYNARKAPTEVNKRKTPSSKTRSTTAKIQKLMDDETPKETKSVSHSDSEAVAIPAETLQSGSRALSATPTQTPFNALAGSALFFSGQQTTQTPVRQVPRRFTPKVIIPASSSHCLHISYMTGMPQHPQPLLWLPSPSPYAASSPHMFAHLQQPSQSLSSLPVDTFFRAYSAN